MIIKMKRLKRWFFKLIASYPRWIASIVFILSSVCIFIALTYEELPDFSDPALGFESRGTTIASRLTAWHNLLEETRPSGCLTSNLYEKTVPRQNFTKPTKTLKNVDKQNKRRKLAKNFGNKNSSLSHNSNVVEDGSEEGSESTGKNKHKTGKNKHKKIEHEKDDYFCDAPNREYVHMVLVRFNGNASLLQMDAMQAICELEKKLTNIESYKGFCQMKEHSKECCRPWSIPNYIALLSNKTSCFEIQESDLSQTYVLLNDCYNFYANGSLKSDCENFKCFAPAKCMQFNAVYHILHFLTDNKFNATNSLISTQLILPMAKTTKILPYYYDSKPTIENNEVISVVASDMGLKNELFDDLLFTDALLIGFGAIGVLKCILIYTNSILITVSMVVANVLSIGVAYFVYKVVFQLSYFPFMNLLAIVVIVGIGADDCFIYVKEWRLSADEWDTTAKHLPRRNGKKSIFLVTNTMEHAVKSIFVTSLTTAHAFMASYSTPITDIQCFSIYAATVIMVNYVLMKTWLPATVIIVEEMNMQLCKCWQSYVDSINVLIERFGNTMERAIIRFVKKFHYTFLVIFFFIGISSGVIVLYYPKLKPPDSQTFQLLHADHPFEMYDSKYRHWYRFERSFTEAETFNMPVRFVWGVDAIDDGNHLIPTSKGSLHLQGKLNLSSIEAQLWMHDFCKNIKQQSFFQPIDVRAISLSCYIENLIDNMNKRCFDPMTNTSRQPCCEQEKFPYKPEVFEKCLPEMISSLYRSPRYIFVPGVSGPKFERNPAQESKNDTSSESNDHSSIRALVIEYESTQPFSTSYTEMYNFSINVENWFNDMLKSAPDALKNGWFTSELGFFDLQQTLSSGTIKGAAIAILSSLIALLLFTMNIRLTLYAVLTVIFTIFTTMAVLVLLGWKLNILESIAVNTAIGLGIDYVLHYALKYQQSEIKDRKSSTEFTLSHMIGPTLMAATTSIIAAIFLFFSSVLAYKQIGILLLVVTTISWLFATFFFASVLWIIGPEKQINTRSHQDDAQAMQHLNDVKSNSRKPTHLKKTEHDTKT